MNLFDLVAVLTLNKGNYEQGLGEAEEEATSFSSKVKSGLTTASKVGAATLGALGAGATAVTKKMLDTSSATASLGDHIDKQSQKIGMSAKAYQEWDFILTHNGASVDSLQASMKTLSTQAEKNADEFQALGISQKDIENSSPEELFERVVKSLQNMEAGTERTAIASKLLGRGATELAPVLNSTSDEIESMRKQAHDLGKVLSDDAVKSGAAYEDSLYNLQSAMGGIKNQMAGELLPSIVSVMDGLTGVLSGDSGAVGKISEGVTNLMSKIAEAIPRFAEIATNLITTFGQALTQNMPALTKSAVTIIKALVKAITDNLPMIIDMGIEVIMALIDGLLEALPQLINGLITLVVKVVEKLPTIIMALIRAIPKIIKSLIEGLITAIPQIIQGLIQLVLELVEHIPEIISELIQAIPEIISMIINGFLSNIPQLVTGAIQLVVGIVTHLPEIIAGLIAAIPQIISSILSAFGPLGGLLGDLFGGALEVAGNVLGELGEIAKGVFDWIGTLMTDPAQALMDAFDGIKNYAVKVFESIKQIVGGIFELIENANDAEKARDEKERSKALLKQKLTEAKMQGDWDMANMIISNMESGGIHSVEEIQEAKMEISGHLTVDGVNSEGELVASADYAVDQVNQQLTLDSRR